jgi:hypothetical protein
MQFGPSTHHLLCTGLINWKAANAQQEDCIAINNNNIDNDEDDNDDNNSNNNIQIFVVVVICGEQERSSLIIFVVIVIYLVIRGYDRYVRLYLYVCVCMRFVSRGVRGAKFDEYWSLRHVWLNRKYFYIYGRNKQSN